MTAPLAGGPRFPSSSCLRSRNPTSYGLCSIVWSRPQQTMVEESQGCPHFFVGPWPGHSASMSWHAASKTLNLLRVPSRFSPCSAAYRSKTTAFCRLADLGVTETRDSSFGCPFEEPPKGYEASIKAPTCGHRQTCWCSVGNDSGNQKGDFLKGNRRGSFIGIIHSFPAEN